MSIPSELPPTTPQQQPPSPPASPLTPLGPPTTDNYASVNMQAWEKMFGGMATADQIKQMVQSMLNSFTTQMQADQQNAVNAIKQMKEDMEESQG